MPVSSPENRMAVAAETDGTKRVPALNNASRREADPAEGRASGTLENQRLDDLCRPARALLLILYGAMAVLSLP